MNATFAAADVTNIVDGELAKQLESALAEVADILENAEQFERPKDVLRARVTFELVLERQGDDAMVSVSLGSKVHRPRRRQVSRTMFYQAGVFTVPLLTQGPLFGEEPAVRKPIALHPTSTKE